jgi:hypothetical protein
LRLMLPVPVYTHRKREPGEMYLQRIRVSAAATK